MKIELIYEKNCPHWQAARKRLIQALHQTGQPLHWSEWDSTDPKSPHYARQYGSPTILINGQDILGQKPNDHPCCRLYRNQQGQTSGVPELNDIVQAIHKYILST